MNSEKMYILVFLFLGVLNILAFFVYKSKLEKQSREKYTSLAAELDNVLQEGDKKLQSIIKDITNDYERVIAEFRDGISSSSPVPFDNGGGEVNTKPVERQLDYYWYVSCGVPFIELGREHFTIGDTLPTGEVINRINDYCIRTDDGTIIYNINCRRRSNIVQSEGGINNVSRVD